RRRQSRGLPRYRSDQSDHHRRRGPGRRAARRGGGRQGYGPSPPPRGSASGGYDQPVPAVAAMTGTGLRLESAPGFTVRGVSTTTTPPRGLRVTPLADAVGLRPDTIR